MTDPTEAGPALTVDQDLDTEEAGTDAAEDRSRMSFLDHLDELRKRILYSLYAIVACCILTFVFWERTFVYLANYFKQFGGDLIYNRPMGAFMFSMWTSVLAGLLLASPFVFSQLWLFVAPGLYAKEKRVVIPFVFFASLLFAAGAFFAHTMAFPAMWKFFASYNDLGGIKFLANIDEAFNFYMWTILGLGLTFQMPIAMYFLARFGIVTARFLLKQFRYAVLIIFIIAAVVTPSADPVTQTIFAAPMIVLYILSIGVAWVFGKPRPKEQD
jgi:sec-independent protein translocase protein TatC